MTNKPPSKRDDLVCARRFKALFASRCLKDERNRCLSWVDLETMAQGPRKRVRQVFVMTNKKFVRTKKYVVRSSIAG